MNLLVKSFPQPTELQEATEQISNLANTLAVYKVSLSNEARKNLRVVGASRMGLVDMVAKIATRYDDKLAKTDVAEDLNMRVQYMHLLRNCRIAAKKLHELLDDTEKALANNVMAYTDKFSASLRSARKYDGDLDEVMKSVDDYNARFGAVMDQEDENTESSDTDPVTPQ